MKSLKKTILFALALTAFSTSRAAHTDTLRVMAYNVLYYGNGCQGPNGNYHEYLRTIVSYANPDILCLDKMASIPVQHGDPYGIAPEGFADSILTFALNAAFPGRYDYCPFTNNARSSSGTLLFYDRRKLGYLAIVSSYANITDFNTYKLYYKDPALASTHDTTFLYVIPSHDRSGDENEPVRALQIANELEQLHRHFSALPNFINMGDFNSRSSEETFYQELVNPADTAFRFYDPPFFPDRRVSYPAPWDHNSSYSAYLTTATRESASIPNSCGTGGGAKNWYDHIFLSSWIVNNLNHIGYIPGSYHTIGNDGQRFGISINNNLMHTNTSAPAGVIEALYQMSNKYPVMLSLLVTSNISGQSPVDPEIPGAPVFVHHEATITNPVKDDLEFQFPGDMAGQDIKVECFDASGTQVMKKKQKVTGSQFSLKCPLAPGAYKLKVTGHHNAILDTTLTKE